MTNYSDSAILDKIPHDVLTAFLKKRSEENYNYFVEALVDDIKDIINELESNREQHFSASEDNITSFICSLLKFKGYDASEQTKKNGDVDLTVEKNDFKWIAEAKIGVSNDKILEGLLQLLTRYVTRDSSCGLLVYIKKDNIKRSIDDWQKYITNNSKWSRYVCKKRVIAQNDIQTVLNNVSIDKVDSVSFKSNHTLVSGFPIQVNNFFINLYHNPTDTSGNQSIKHKKAVAKEKLAHLYFENIDEFKPDMIVLKNILEDFFCDYDPDDSNPII